MERLPSEILYLVVKFLDIDSIINLSRCNNKFRHTIYGFKQYIIKKLTHCIDHTYLPRYILNNRIKFLPFLYNHISIWVYEFVTGWTIYHPLKIIDVDVHEIFKVIIIYNNTFLLESILYTIQNRYGHPYDKYFLSFVEHHLTNVKIVTYKLIEFVDNYIPSNNIFSIFDKIDLVEIFMEETYGILFSKPIDWFGDQMNMIISFTSLESTLIMVFGHPSTRHYLDVTKGFRCFSRMFIYWIQNIHCNFDNNNILSSFRDNNIWISDQIKHWFCTQFDNWYHTIMNNKELTYNYICLLVYLCNDEEYHIDYFGEYLDKLEKNIIQKRIDMDYVEYLDLLNDILLYFKNNNLHRIKEVFESTYHTQIIQSYNINLSLLEELFTL